MMRCGNFRLRRCGRRESRCLIEERLDRLRALAYGAFVEMAGLAKSRNRLECCLPWLALANPGDQQADCGSGKRDVQRAGGAARPPESENEVKALERLYTRLAVGSILPIRRVKRSRSEKWASPVLSTWPRRRCFPRRTRCTRMLHCRKLKGAEGRRFARAAKRNTESPV